MQPFTRRPADSVASLGETALIAALQQWLGRATPPPPRGIGDDCAVLAASPREQVITVDPVIFGQHFDAKVAPRHVGSKLLKRNLSDLAAMGAKPTVAVVALVLAPSVRLRWLEQFYRGLAKAALQYGVAIVGGDISQAPGALTASLTLLGQATTTRLVTRQGARLGDWIYVTGKLGGSRLGRHYSFAPRLAEGAWLATRAEVRSMMDLSDGLAKDVHALTPTRARPGLWSHAIPISSASKTLAAKSKRTPLDHALSDGEDYELVFTLAQSANTAAFEKLWNRKFDTLLTRIGSFVHEDAPAEGLVNLEDFRGYEHLR